MKASSYRPARKRTKKQDKSRSGLVVEALEARIAPAATVTLNGTLANDVDNDGVADPGDRIHYVATVDNASPSTPITLQSFTELINDPNLIFVPGSLNVSPLTLDNTYTAVGNTTLLVGTPSVVPSGPAATNATKVTDNDIEFLGSTIAGNTQILSIDTTNANGTVNMVTSGANMGSFSYLPNAGFTGTATFTYTLTDAGADGSFATTTDNLTNTATVTITVGEAVWYVDDSATPGGDGTSDAPLQSLEALSTGGTSDTLDNSNDTIFVYNGSYAANAGRIVLESGQRLIGEGVTLVVDGFTLVTGASGNTPTLAPSTGTAVTLATGNTLSGFIVGDSQRDILGTGFGTLTVSNVTLNGTGKTLDLENGTFAAGSSFISISTSAVTGLATDGHGMRLVNIDGSVSFGSTSIAGSTAQGIFVNLSDANISFGNTTVTMPNTALANVEGIRFEANDGGTRSFGTLTISSANTTGIGMQISDTAGTVSSTGLVNFTSSTGNALVVGGAATVNFNSLSTASVAGAGISLNTTHTGSFTVGTGGTISGVTGTDVSISGGTGSVSIGSAITNGTGGFISIDNHDQGNVTFSGNLSTTAQGISVTNSGGGTNPVFTFSGTTKTLNTGTNTAVNLTGNTNGTISFTGGGLVITTSSVTGFNATGGGTVNVTGSGNTITSTSGATALNIVSTTIGGSHVTFQSISSNGGSATGIILDGTGTSGGLRVTGTGSAGTGGTIANKTGADGATTTGVGIYLNNTSDVQLSRMQLNDFQNYAIRGLGVNGFSLTSSVINGVNGNNVGVDEGAVIFGVRNGTTGLTGTASVTNTTISGGAEDNLGVYNTSGTLTLTVDGATITGAGNDGIITEQHIAGTINTDVKNSIFSNNIGDHYQSVANGAAIINAKFGTNGANSLTTSNPAVLGGSVGIQTGVGWSGSGSASIANNTITFAKDTPINVNIGGIGTFNAVVHNNTIGTSGSVGSGTTANEDAIRIVANGDKATDSTPDGATLNVAVTNNTLQQVSGRGILVFGRDGGTAADPIQINATITGNIFRQSPNSGGQALRVEAGASSTPTPDTVRLHADIGGAGALANVFQDDWGTNLPAGIDFDELRVVDGPGDNQVILTNLGADTSLSGVSTYLAGRNSLPAGGVASAAGSSFSSGGAPTQPVIPLLFAPALPESSPTPEIEPPADTPPVLPPVVILPVTPDAPSIIVDDGILSQAELDSLVAAAIARWEATGLTAEQVATLRSVVFTVEDLPSWQLGDARPGLVTLDTHAAGNAWFIDATPLDDNEFAGTGTQLFATAIGGAKTRVDALTTLMHELGHQLGLEDSTLSSDSADLMYGYLSLSERRLPAFGEAAGAVAHDHDLAHAALTFTPDAAPLLGGVTLPVDKSITIAYDGTVANLTNGLAPASVRSQIRVTTGTGTLDSNIASNAVDSLTLGNLIYRDNNVDGVFNAGDAGINGVAVSLFVDANNDNVPDSGTALLTATTAGGGLYAFTGLLPGNYIVQVDQSNFNTGNPLAGLPRVTVYGGDPDNNIDSDSNAVLSAGNGARSQSITLSYNSEPNAGTGNDSNLSVDFGFIPLPTVTVAASAAVAEAGGNITYTFTRSDSLDGLTVNFNLSGTASLSASDFALIANPAVTFNSGDLTGTITFAPGSTTATLVIDPTDDAIVEANETVIATVTTGSTYTLGAQVVATGTINNDDAATVTLSGGIAQTEGNAGTTSYTFTVTLNAAVQGGFTLAYNTNDGTATTADGDYVDNDGNLTFAGTVNETKTITVLANGDIKVELNETFTVALGAIGGAPAGVTAAGSPQTATITNDDSATVSISGAVSQNEGTSPFVYTVTLSNPVDTAVTVLFNTSDGTATVVDNDYVGITGQTVTFAAGTTTAQVVNVTVNNDNKVEANEGFSVSIGTLNASGRNVTLGTSAASGTILNDDTATINLTGGGSFNEATGTRTFTATLSAPVQGGFTVAYNTNDGTAVAGSDYTDNDGILTFLGNAGEQQTITVTILNDSIIENDETFTVTLGAISGAPTGVSAIGSPQTGTILNDEIDFGDLPTAAQSGFAGTYPTLLADGGARHNTVLGFQLGATIDGENDGQPNVTATGDGADEDGVTLPALFVTGTNASITVNASAPGFLNGFIDWNRDGDFIDAGESLGNVAVVAGNNVLSVPVPAGASVGTSFARFRFSSAGELGAGGSAADGEVEDYRISVSATSVSVAVAPGSVAENTSTGLVYTFTRTGDTSGALPINFNFAGTAALTDDYTAASAAAGFTFNGGVGTITFPAGQSTVTLTLTPSATNDTLIEGDETAVLTVATGTGYAAGGSPATGTITDDDFGVISIVSTASSGEGTAAQGVAVTLQLTANGVAGTGTLVNAVSVNLADLLTGTATGADSDYTFSSPQTVTFAGGAASSTQNVSFTLVNDARVEGSETINFQLDNLSGGNAGVTLGNAGHVFTITDDDIARIRFSGSSSTVGEGDSSGALTAVLSITAGPGSVGTPTLDRTVTFDVTAPVGGTATNGADFTTPATATFGVGSTHMATTPVNVALIDDRIVEGTESQTFGLAVAIDGTGGQVAIATGMNATHAMTITDNDTATVVFSTGSQSVLENAGTAAVDVQLVFSTTGTGSLGLANAVSVQLSAGGTGLSPALGAGIDYTFTTPTTVTFAAGTYAESPASSAQSVTITQDTLVEGAETLILGLGTLVDGNGGAVTLGATTAQTVTITDDDFAVISFIGANTTTTEGGGSNANVTVNLQITANGNTTGTLARDVSVNVADLLNGSAMAGSDYTTLGFGTLTFAAGSGNSGTAVSVGAVNDRRVEGSESMQLGLDTLVDGTGGQVTLGSQTTHLVLINDNDTATIGFVSGTGTVNEAAGTYTATVGLIITADGTGTADIERAVSAQVNAPGTGTALGGGVDYTFASQPVTFTAGSTDGATQVVSGTITNDTIAESNETFGLTLGSLNDGSEGQVTLGTSAQTVTILDNDVDLVVAKSATATVNAGENITYTIDVTNNGIVPADTVSLSDLLPAGTTFVSASGPGGWILTAPAVGGTGTVNFSIDQLAAGAVSSFTIVVKTSASLATGSSISNTASVSTTTTDGNSENDSALANTSVTTLTDLALTKSASDAVAPGTNITYTITLDNTGPSDALTVALSDLLPAGTTFVSATQTSGPTFGISSPAVGGTGTVLFSAASFGASAQATFTIVVNSGSIAAGTNVTNTATVTTTTTELDTEDNTSSDTTLIGGVNLSVTKENNNNDDIVVPGETITYRIGYANNGFQNAPGVVLTETLPAGTTFIATGSTAGWTETAPGSGTYTLTIGTVNGTGSGPEGEAGSGEAIFIVGVVGTAPAGLDSIENETTISYDNSQGPDTDSEDNTATDSDTLNAAPDLTVTKTNPLVSVPRGNVLQYTINYSNAGNQNATGVVLRETLPAGTTFSEDASSEGWTLDGGQYVLVLGNVTAGTNGTVTFGVTVNSAGPDTINNTVTIDDDNTNGTEPETEDNTASLSKPIYEGIYAVGPGNSLLKRGPASVVRVFDIATGTEIHNFMPYGGTYRDTVRLAIADMNNDGFDDIITGTRAGTGRVSVFDGLTGEQFDGVFAQLNPFNGKSDKGAFLAAGDVTGDGRPDIVVGGRAGLKVYDGVSGLVIQDIKPFGKKFTGGIRVAVGDIDGDGGGDVVVSQSDLGNTVRVYDGASSTILQQFKVGNAKYRGGVAIATADLNDDGRDDIIAGRNLGRPTVIEVFSGANGQPLGASITPFGANYRYGVRVATADVNGDGVADIIAAAGDNGNSQVRFYDGITRAEITALAFNAFPVYPKAPLFVAGSRPMGASIQPA